MEDAITQAAALIRAADAFLLAAGAGMGVDSGLPDFRGNEGFWSACPALRAEGLSLQDLANPAWFQRDPRRAWGFYGHRYRLYQATRPRRGFSLLRRWVEEKHLPSFVFTSNVDGHFQKAGFSQEQVYECHGSIHYVQCSRCCCGRIWPTPPLHFSLQQSALKAEGELPCCPRCGALARPNILMFGDDGWLSSRSDQQFRRFQAWHEVMGRQATLVVIELGAGTAVPTARYAAESMSAPLVRINPRDWCGPVGTVSVRLWALAALQAIEAVL